LPDADLPHQKYMYVCMYVCMYQFSLPCSKLNMRCSKDGKCGCGLMVNAQDSGSRGLGLNPSWGHCPWARHFTLMMPLSTQVYKFNAEGNPGMDLYPIKEGNRITPSCFMLRNRK